MSCHFWEMVKLWTGKWPYVKGSSLLVIHLVQFVQPSMKSWDSSQFLPEAELSNTHFCYLSHQLYIRISVCMCFWHACTSAAVKTVHFSKTHSYCVSKMRWNSALQWWLLIAQVRSSKINALSQEPQELWAVQNNFTWAVQGNTWEVLLLDQHLSFRIVLCHYYQFWLIAKLSDAST